MVPIPKTQSGYRLIRNPSNHLERVELPVPRPNHDELLLKVAAAGVCHSDLHILDNSNPSTLTTEYIMGHEIAGHIVAIGESLKAENYPIGQLVAVHGTNGCGSCRPCRAGIDNQCTQHQWFGLGIDGGYEEYVVVPHRSAIFVPDGVAPEVAAVTTDAVLTPYHAIKRAGINSMTRVLLIGLGGLGLNALQICKALGAHVTATDLKQSSREAAKKLGADVVVENAKEHKVDPYDVVLDVVGSKQTFYMAQQLVKVVGIVIPIGLANPILEINQHPASMKEIQIISTFWGTSGELAECLDLVAQGKVTPKVQKGDFNRLEEYLEMLHEGKVESRLAIIPSSN